MFLPHLRAQEPCMVDLAAFLWLIASLFVFLAIVRITT
jgi:hypothetical protein